MLPSDTKRRRQIQAEVESAEGLEQRRRLAAGAAERGEARSLTYRVPTYLPLSVSTIDDAASLLGRLYKQGHSLDLDIPTTVNATIAAGGRSVPHFESGYGVRELRVLIDIERGDQPWQGGFGRVLDYLERLGVRLSRYTFQHVPAWVTPVGGGQPLSFDELGRRYGQDPLILFSRRLSTHSRTGRSDWTYHLQNWTLRTWIDPDPRSFDQSRQTGEPHLVTSLRLQRFPWTEDGFLALARYLASDGEDCLPVPQPDLKPPPLDAICAWAAFAALVPEATWDQLEAVRRHADFPEVSGFVRHPWQLQHLLDWVERKTGNDPVSGDGRTLELPAHVVEELIRQQLRENRISKSLSPFEGRARLFLLDQLKGERPLANHQLGRLWWMLKQSSHLMVLEPQRAALLFEQFRGSAVEHEAREILGAELSRQKDGFALAGNALPWVVAEKLNVLIGQPQGAPFGCLVFGRQRLWFQALGLALVITSIVAMTVWFAKDSQALATVVFSEGISTSFTYPAHFEFVESEESFAIDPAEGQSSIPEMWRPPSE